MPSKLRIFEARGTVVGALERKLWATSRRHPVSRRAADGAQDPHQVPYAYARGRARPLRAQL
jgi:hypothetical protein